MEDVIVSLLSALSKGAWAGAFFGVGNRGDEGYAIGKVAMSQGVGAENIRRFIH